MTMSPEQKKTIILGLERLAHIDHYYGVPEGLHSAATVARNMLPLFTERSNSKAFKEAVRTVGERGRNAIVWAEGCHGPGTVPDRYRVTPVNSKKGEKREN